MIVFTAISMIIMYVLRNVAVKREQDLLVTRKREAKALKAIAAGALTGVVIEQGLVEEDDDGLAGANAADIW